MKNLPKSPLSTESQGTISFKVSSNNTPISDIEIQLEDTNENIYTAKTGIAGGCKIRNLQYGRYKLKILNTPEEYQEKQEEEINLNEKTMKINIELEKNT